MGLNQLPDMPSHCKVVLHPHVVMQQIGWGRTLQWNATGVASHLIDQDKVPNATTVVNRDT